MKPLNAEKLKTLLHYEPETGIFTWRVPSGRWGRVPAGTRAGSLNKTTGSRIVRIDGDSYLEHRLAWLYVHGVWPSECIDHINGVRSQNDIKNLRDVSHVTNGQNQRRAHPRNISGLLGVSWNARDRSWKASITVAGKNKNLGCFTTPEQAHQAYLTAKRNLHAGCTI